MIEEAKRFAPSQQEVQALHDDPTAGTHIYCNACDVVMNILPIAAVERYDRNTLAVRSVIRRYQCPQCSNRVDVRDSAQGVLTAWVRTDK